MEVCIDDQWHEMKRSVLIANNSQSLQDISVMIVDSTSESVMLEWSGQLNDKNISGYDLSCTTSLLSDHGQIHEVRVYPTLVQVSLGSGLVDYYQAQHTSAVSMHTYRVGQTLHLI